MTQEVAEAKEKLTAALKAMTQQCRENGYGAAAKDRVEAFRKQKEAKDNGGQ